MASEIDNAIADPRTYGDEAKIHACFEELRQNDPVHWHDLQRLDSDDLTIRIVGHDEPQDGEMVVYVACASHAVRDRLEDGWS